MSGRLRHEKGAGKPRACHSFVIADRALPQRPPTAALGTRGFVHLDRFGPGCRSRSFRRDLRDFGRLGGFFGCRFRDQLTRTYARQVMKRSAGPHFAVLPAAELTRNELRFIAEQGIAVIDRPLADAAATLVAAYNLCQL